MQQRQPSAISSPNVSNKDNGSETCDLLSVESAESAWEQAIEPTKCPSNTNCREQLCGQRHNTILHADNNRHEGKAISLEQTDYEPRNSGGKENSFATINSKKTNSTMDIKTGTKTTNLL